MSDNASAGAETDGAESASSRSDEYQEMLESVDTAIEEARRKVDSGRVYDPENEKVRIKWIRALAYAVNVRRQVTVDRDLEELAERIERLEEHQQQPMEGDAR